MLDTIDPGAERQLGSLQIGAVGADTFAASVRFINRGGDLLEGELDILDALVRA